MHKKFKVHFHIFFFFFQLSNENSKIEEKKYKILILGDIGTGKTSIIHRFVHNSFSSEYKATVK